MLCRGTRAQMGSFDPQPQAKALPIDAQTPSPAAAGQTEVCWPNTVADPAKSQPVPASVQRRWVQVVEQNVVIVEDCSRQFTDLLVTVVLQVTSSHEQLRTAVQVHAFQRRSSQELMKRCQEPFFFRGLPRGLTVLWRPSSATLLSRQ